MMNVLNGGKHATTNVDFSGIHDRALGAPTFSEP